MLVARHVHIDSGTCTIFWVTGGTPPLHAPMPQPGSAHPYTFTNMSSLLMDAEMVILAISSCRSNASCAACASSSISADQWATASFLVTSLRRTAHSTAGGQEGSGLRPFKALHLCMPRDMCDKQSQISRGMHKCSVAGSCGWEPGMHASMSAHIHVLKLEANSEQIHRQTWATLLEADILLQTPGLQSLCQLTYACSHACRHACIGF